jgi:2-polyprenyl-6-methoxyphenol hydroxylase-like FAD-dependent oxidoreductase
MNKLMPPQTSHIAKRAIVIGAGVGGLAAARALSDFCEEVVIVERDALRDDATARPGVPQGKHPHGLLAAAMTALEYLFAGFSQDLAAAGAVLVDPGSEVLFEYPGIDRAPRVDFGWSTYAMSRPLLESCLLRHLKQVPKIKLFTQARVRKILGAPDGSTVTGIEFEGPNGVSETLSGEIVVDASGHGALTLNFLRSSSCRLPEETVIGVDIRYYSTVFATPEAFGDYKVIVTVPKAPDHVRFGYILPAEHNRLQVLMVGRGEEIPPVDGHEFLAYAQELETPTIYNTIKGAQCLSGIARFSFPEGRWRHFGWLGEFPRGLLPLADTICRLNPVWGQGIAIAFKEAELLHRVLQAQASEANRLDALSKTFLGQVESLIADPWEMSAVPDFVYPQTRGERPPDLADRLRFQQALQRIAVHDSGLYKLIAEVRHLLKPAEVLQQPEIVHRVEEELARAEPVNATP